MTKKMKILAAGDIHGDTKLAEELAKKADKEKVDLVVLCGDIVASESNTAGIIGPFVKKNKKGILIPGNHETIATADFLAELYGATNLHGYSMQLGKQKELGLFGCGLANIGQFGLKEQEIYDILKKSYGMASFANGGEKGSIRNIAKAPTTKAEKLFGLKG